MTHGNKQTLRGKYKHNLTPTEQIARKKAILRSVEEFVESQKPLDPDCQKILQDNYWDLLE